VSTYLGACGLLESDNLMARPPPKKRIFRKCRCRRVIATYGFVGKSRVCCTRCKEPGMVDMNHKPCRCGLSQPTFGVKGGKVTCCVKCKSADMISNNKNRCRCGKAQPAFGINGGKRTCCAMCKDDHMVNLNSLLCECGRVQASFGYEGGKRTHCSECKSDEMVVIGHKRCYCGRAAPSFGVEGEKRTHCVYCKLEGMVLFKKECEREGCDVTASFGTARQQNLRCAEHQKPGDTHFLVKPCASCNLGFSRMKDGLCPYCSPDGKHIKATREGVIKQFLTDRFPDLAFTHNRQIAGRFCQDDKIRPDFLIDAGTHLINLEVDQFQHTGYDSACEVSKMYRTRATLGLPVAFLCYNPDAFKVDGETLRTGKKVRHDFLAAQITEALAWRPQETGASVGASA
jgi:hypothetical protein